MKGIIKCVTGFGLIVLMLLLPVSTSAQEATASARLDTNAMMIGDHVGLQLRFTGPAAASVLWPFLPDTILENINVIGRGVIDTTYSQDKKSVTYTQEINLTCYDSGFYTIPPISFYFNVPPDTNRSELESPMLLLAVHTVQVDTTQAIKPIAGPIRVPITFREMLPWILLALGIVGVALAAIWYIRRRRKREPVFTLKPRIVLLPHEAALREMENLRLKKLWQSGKIKEYYSELTEILRRYIEERFRVPALEQTTAEILDGLMGVGCKGPVLDRLGNLLMKADMVKFAKSTPVASENEGSFNAGLDFIHATISESPATSPLQVSTPEINSGKDA
jgi:hypothetical protein